MVDSERTSEDENPVEEEIPVAKPVPSDEVDSNKAIPTAEPILYAKAIPVPDPITEAADAALADKVRRGLGKIEKRERKIFWSGARVGAVIVGAAATLFAFVGERIFPRKPDPTPEVVAQNTQLKGQVQDLQGKLQDSQEHLADSKKHSEMLEKALTGQENRERLLNEGFFWQGSATQLKNFKDKVIPIVAAKDPAYAALLSKHLEQTDKAIKEFLLKKDDPERVDNLQERIRELVRVIVTENPNGKIKDPAPWLDLGIVKFSRPEDKEALIKSNNPKWKKFGEEPFKEAAFLLQEFGEGPDTMIESRRKANAAEKER